MPTAKGSVATQPPGVSPSSKFNAKLILETTQTATFSANNNVALIAFNSSKALLTYSKNSDLTGKRDYSGIVGAEKFSITLDNDVTITADIVGGPAEGQSISGSGEWMIS